MPQKGAINCLGISNNGLSSVQDFATGKNFPFDQCHNKEFCVFSQESCFIKAIENFFPVFAYPDINTREVGRILDSYANPRLRLGFA